MFYAPRVKESTNTTGTGTITLQGALTGFQQMPAAADGLPVDYLLLDSNAWEEGRGTYTASARTLSRDTVHGSSQGGSKITLSGNATVFLTVSSEVLGRLNPDGADITFASDIEFTADSAVDIGKPAARAANLYVDSIGDTGQALTMAPSSVTWSNDPTHSGNHTFSGTLRANGGIGVNAAALASGIQINDASAPELRLRNTTDLSNARLYNDASGNLVVDAPSALKLFVSSSEAARIDSNGNLLIGTTTPATGNPPLDIFDGSGENIVLTNNVTDSNTKNSSIATRHYTNSEEAVEMIGMSAGATENILHLGGHIGTLNVATQFRLRLGSSTTTLGGSDTEVMRADTSKVVSIVDMKIGGVVTDQPAVRLHAVDSAFEVSRIENTDAGVNSAIFALYRNSNTAASGDNLFDIIFRGNDDAAAVQNYGRVRGAIVDASAASPDGEVQLITTVAGTETVGFRQKIGAFMDGATSGDPGSGKFNAVDLEINGSSVCYVLEVEAARRAGIDVMNPNWQAGLIDKWDGMTPNNSIEEKEEWIDVKDANGNIIYDTVLEKVLENGNFQYRQKPRQKRVIIPEQIKENKNKHIRKYLSRLGTEYDPNTPEGFFKHIADKQHLPAMANPSKFDHLKEKSISDRLDKAYETIDQMAVIMWNMHDRIKQLEAE